MINTSYTQPILKNQTLGTPIGPIQKVAENKTSASTPSTAQNSNYKSIYSDITRLICPTLTEHLFSDNIERKALTL